MRKITGDPSPHNAPRRRRQAAPALGLVLLLGALSTGCGDSQDQATADRRTGGAPQALLAARSCPLLVSRAGLQDFWTLSDRIAAGERYSLEDLVELADSPSWQLWRRSYLQDIVQAEPIGRALFIALIGRDQLPERQRDRTIRLDLVRNFELTRDRRQEITAAVDRFIEQERGCEIRDRLQGYLPAAALPDTLRIEFMVGLPELRLFEDVFMVDAGLAWAAGQEQLTRFLTSTLYKRLTLVEGPIPGNARGVDILLHSLRLVRNEAVAAYIDQAPEIAFEPRHPILGRVSPKPDEFASQALRTLTSLDAGITQVRALAEPTDEDWRNLYRLFVGAQSWQPTGWFMARTIADQLGTARLQEVGRSVPDLVAAYQEAASGLPGTTEAGRGTLEWFLASAPAFSADNAAWLDRELRRLFP